MHDLLHWITEHATDLIGSLGIALGVITLQREVRSRRVGNLISLAAAHRDIWKEFYGRPSLARVLDPKANLASRPLTEEELVFVTDLFLHLFTTWRAIQDDELQPLDSISDDIRDVLSLPVPRASWDRIKRSQNPRFVRFVDESVAE